MNSTFARAGRACVPTLVAAIAILAPLSGAASARETHRSGGDAHHAHGETRGDRHRAAAKRLKELRGRCDREVNKRLHGLDEAAAAITASPWLTDAHKAALAASIAADHDALAALLAVVDAATTPDALRAACTTALDQGGLVRFDIRKARLTNGADYAGAVVGDVQSLINDFNATLDTLAADGVDVSELRAAVTELQAQLDTAANQVDGLGDAIVAISSADFTNGTGGPTLDADSASLTAAAHAMHSIVEELGSLQDSIPGANGDSTDDNGGDTGTDSSSPGGAN